MDLHKYEIDILRVESHYMLNIIGYTVRLFKTVENNYSIRLLNIFNEFKYVTAEVYVNKTLICIFPAYFMINLDNINFNLLEERVMKAIMSNVHKLIDTHSMYYSNKLYSI